MEKTENPGKNDGKIEEEAKDSAALESAKQSEAASLESQEDEAQKDGLDSSSKACLLYTSDAADDLQPV